MAASRGKSKRVIRQQRGRQKISGTSGRPRFSVYRSLNNIYVQVIDDELGNTIAVSYTHLTLPTSDLV